MHSRRGTGEPRAAGRRQAGFTLIEVMVVVAMIGVLASTAVVFVNPSSTAASSRGYAHEVAALSDAVRQRAVASRTYQKLEITADQVIHWQGATTGMVMPEEWNLVGVLPLPADVVIASASARTHVETDDAVPGPGAGIPLDIDFAPDGSATAATVFITDRGDDDRARVAIYRASGSAYAYDEW